MRWQTLAACRGMDPNLFYPERGVNATPAKAVCEACPVTQECLSYGLMEGVGIWGGTSEKQRRRIRGRVSG